MSEVKCSFCGSGRYEERRVDYLYQHDGKFLLVPNTPVQVCSECGMVYYDAKVLKEIERHFFAIQKHEEEPDSIMAIPMKRYTA